MASNSENGIGHLRALVPWLMMMKSVLFKSNSAIGQVRAKAQVAFFLEVVFENHIKPTIAM